MEKMNAKYVCTLKCMHTTKTGINRKKRNMQVCILEK